MAKAKILYELLNRKHPEEMMYIGTEEGGGWLVIDTAEHVLEDLEEIDANLKKFHAKFAAEYQGELDRLPADITRIQEKIEIAIKDEDPEETARLTRLLRNKESRYVCSYNGRKKYNTALSKWKPFGERKILGEYPHKTEVVGSCVIIDGFEKGDYWFKEEYDKEKNK